MATETTSTSAQAWSPDLRSVAPTTAVPQALVLATSTVSGSIEGDSPSVWVAYVDDAATEAPPAPPRDARPCSNTTLPTRERQNPTSTPQFGPIVCLTSAEVRPGGTRTQVTLEPATAA